MKKLQEDFSMKPNPALIPGSGCSEFFKSDDRFYCARSGIIEETLPGTPSYNLAVSLMDQQPDFKPARNKSMAENVNDFIDKYLSSFNYTPDSVDDLLTDYDGSKRFEIDGTKISTREQDVIKEISTGKLDKEIASKLFISVHTVSTTIRNIRQKLNATSKYHIIAIAAKSGLL